MVFFGALFINSYFCPNKNFIDDNKVYLVFIFRRRLWWERIPPLACDSVNEMKTNDINNKIRFTL